jgi:hypothetical protein
MEGDGEHAGPSYMRPRQFLTPKELDLAMARIAELEEALERASAAASTTRTQVTVAEAVCHGR